MQNEKKGMSLIVLVLIAIVVIVVGAISIVLVINKDNSVMNENTNTSNAQNDENISTSPNNNVEIKEDNINSSTKEITLKVVQNYQESPESDFEVVDHGNGVVELLRYLGDDEIVVIPESVKGKRITHIASFVFANDYHPNTKAIRLSDSVEVVDMSAFGLNTSIEIFVAGAGLQEIGQGAFQNCTSLRQVILNDGLKKIEGFAFGGCTKLNEMEIPESVVDLQLSIFYGIKDSMKILGTAGSTAEQYAIKEGIDFQVSK